MFDSNSKLAGAAARLLYGSVGKTASGKKPARTQDEKKLRAVQARIASGTESAGELRSLKRKELELKAIVGVK